MYQDLNLRAAVTFIALSLLRQGKSNYGNSSTQRVLDLLNSVSAITNKKYLFVPLDAFGTRASIGVAIVTRKQHTCFATCVRGCRMMVVPDVYTLEDTALTSAVKQVAQHTGALVLAHGKGPHGQSISRQQRVLQNSFFGRSCGAVAA